MNGRREVADAIYMLFEATLQRRDRYTHTAVASEKERHTIMRALCEVTLCEFHASLMKPACSVCRSVEYAIP